MDTDSIYHSDNCLFCDVKTIVHAYGGTNMGKEILTEEEAKEARRYAEKVFKQAIEDWEKNEKSVRNIKKHAWTICRKTRGDKYLAMLLILLDVSQSPRQQQMVEQPDYDRLMAFMTAIAAWKS